MNEGIVDYIRRNQRVYTREAITQELLKAGFAQADIEASWLIVENSPPTGPYLPTQYPGGATQYYGGPPPQYYGGQVRRVRPPNGPRFWLAYLGLVVATLLTGSLGLNSSIFGWTFWLVLLGGIVGAAVTRERDPAVSRGLVTGIVTLLILLVVVPFVVLVIILGLCLTGVIPTP